jgi:uracil phosphoribosyltransferase
MEVILMDPMLATGGSTLAAMKLLAERGAVSVRMVNLIATRSGIRAVHHAYPGLPIFTAAIDRKLNQIGYIVPGLGDAGDRLFGV